MSHHHPFWLRSVLAASLSLSLAACGAGTPTTQSAAPTVQITSPSAAGEVTQERVRVTCVVSGDVVRVSYTLNGGAPVNVPVGGTEYGFELQGVREGENKLVLSVTNAAGITTQGLLDFFWGGGATDARDDATATETGRTTRILVLDNDRGRNLRVSALGQAANGTATLDGTRVEYRPDAGFVGTDTFTYTAAGDRGTDTATVTVNVLPRNPEAPTANDDAATTAVNTATGIAVLANDTDPDNDPLMVLSVTQPANGTAEVVFNGFTGRSEAVKYTPNPGFTGTDSFSYQMSDSDGFNEGDGGDTALVTVTVR